MAAQTSMLHVRVDENVKVQATQALAAMGLSVSDAVRLFLHRVVADQCFPLELKVPNTATRAAMEEARLMMAKGSATAGPSVEASWPAARPLKGRFALLPLRDEVITPQHVRDLMEREGI